MNWSVPDLHAASLWQFSNALTGWKQANCPPEAPKAPTTAQFDSTNWDFDGPH